MAKVLVSESNLTAIANAIRAKQGTQSTYTPSNMANAISSIPSGITPSGTITITTNGTHNVSSYASADVSVPTNEIYYSTTGHAYTADMIMPSSVTSIDASTYNECTNLVSMQMSNAITSLGAANVFYKCTNLTQLTLPTNATGSIGQNFCSFCQKLANVTIPSGITSIGYGGFAHCYLLNNVVVPNGVTSIAQNAFAQNFSLSNISIPNSVTSIHTRAFNECSALKNITLADGFLATINLTASTQFTADDIIAMFNKLGDVPEGETRTMSLGATNLAKLTNAQKLVATSRGWTLA